MPARRGRLLVALFIVTYAVIAGSPTPPGKANDLVPAASPSGQVRIFQEGVFVGGGTLVDRNWVLTVDHMFLTQLTPAAYSIRFGVINDHNDPNDTTNLRSIDRIVQPPQGGGGMAMVHLANPVPEGTWIPSLATRPPERYDDARFYGWGADEHALHRTSTIVFDPVASLNAALLRRMDATFARAFPVGIEPMVINGVTADGDSGSGVFVDNGTLTGVHIGDSMYRRIDSTGRLYFAPVTASYEEPVWRYRQWILDTINGAGPSGTTPDPSQNHLPRRQLTDATDSDLPMTMPPQPATCGEDTQCPDPGWAQGILLGAGNYRGTAQARCATAQNNTCSFNGTTYPAGTSARITLGPDTAPLAPGTRQVMVWCKTTTAFPNPDSPTQPVLRVSFTNADPHQSPIGYGWWDLTPDQISPANSQPPLNTSPLNPC